ncbi:MAG: sugar phosphate isomerase/epimerase [Clostridia bacterium]|nr:sugar phosphate isomerase/epimerase [Clostridia bacterium]
MLYSTTLDVLAINYGREKGIDILADAGFPAIDFSMFRDLDEILADDWKETAKKYKAIADSRGVVFNQSHAPFGGGFDHYNNNLIPQMPRFMEFAAALGVKQIIIHPLQKVPYLGREEEMFEINMNMYSSLAPYAKNCGIKIAIENMWQNRPVTNYICDDVCADPRELNRYYDTLGDPEAFTVCLDLGHVALCGREPQDAIRAIGHDRLGALHVHDVDYVHDLHTLPGSARINWDAVCRALAEINYEGQFTLESDGFLKKYDVEFQPTASRFMADVCKHLTDKIEKYKAK